MSQLFEIEIPEALKRERRTRRKAEAENQAKDEFFAFFLHELKNPLNAVYGWSRLLATGDLDRTQTLKAVETINRNADFLSDFVQDWLDFSRIINGKMRIERRAVNLREVVENALEDFLPAADSRNIFLAASFDCSDCEIFGDTKRLRQIVGNLLSNSIKFTPSGGFVAVDLRRTAQTAEIVIKDSGIGIEPKFLPYIFERFCQDQESVRHGENSGLGLGLAVVRHLVELHCGCVEVCSDGAGKGAIFTVKLPLAA